MKTHLNTLFVTTDGAYLAKSGLAVAVRIPAEPADADAEDGRAGPKKVALRVPLHNLDGVVAFGRVGASPALLGAAAEAGVTVSFLSRRGRFRYAAVGFSPGNVLLRRSQYRAADSPDASAEIARSVLLGKLANGRTALRRGSREADGETADRLAKAADRLDALLVEVRRVRFEEGRPPLLDRLRGLEGEAAAGYFAAFDSLITADGFTFNGRSRRPPLDPVNAVLSFVYTLLTHDVRSACEAAGLDAAVGFLHRDRPGRPGLALDLVEELRAPLADRLTLAMLNRGQLAARHFESTASGAVHLTDAGRKTVLTAWQKRKAEELRHPFLDERMTWGLVPHIQARLLARHLRGDTDAYVPFLWK